YGRKESGERPRIRKDMAPPCESASLPESGAGYSPLSDLELTAVERLRLLDLALAFLVLRRLVRHLRGLDDAHHVAFAAYPGRGDLHRLLHLLLVVGDAGERDDALVRRNGDLRALERCVLVEGIDHALDDVVLGVGVERRGDGRVRVLVVGFRAPG